MREHTDPGLGDGKAFTESLGGTVTVMRSIDRERLMRSIDRERVSAGTKSR